jgi:hypothetical protein
MEEARAGDLSHPPPSSLRSLISLKSASNNSKIFKMMAERFFMALSLNKIVLQ